MATARVKMNLGLFAQDQWTMRNLTLNLGLRYDYFNAYNPAQTRPAGAYTPEFSFEEVPNVPNWKDVTPRFGAAYDFRGDGKTALKVSLGKYMTGIGTNIAQNMNPANQIAGTATRTWNDSLYGPGDPRSGNYVPDCDLRNQRTNGECGDLSDLAFGTTRFVQTFDTKVIDGWGVRPANWQVSAVLQRELRSGVALNVGYYRTWDTNDARVTNNRSVEPSDFDEFCITVPTDDRLADSGQQICGLYDIKPAKFGLRDDFITAASDFGVQTRVYNGADIGIEARFAQGARLSGGVSLGSTVADNCDVIIDSPEKRFCRTTNPYQQVKLVAVYPLPWWGIQTSAVFQNEPGINWTANYVVSNAEIARTLGRNLGQCGTQAVCTATRTVQLIEPNTAREPRQSQLDLRAAKIFRLGRVRLRGNFDIYNALNANSVQTLATTYNSTWLNAGSILPARMFKGGVQLDF
jgi:hypothetical protein